MCKPFVCRNVISIELTGAPTLLILPLAPREMCPASLPRHKRKHDLQP